MLSKQQIISQNLIGTIMKLNLLLNTLPNELNAKFQLDKKAKKLGAWLKKQALKREIAHERNVLAELPDYLLKDIGLDHQKAQSESHRAFDDIPSNRVKELSVATDTNQHRVF